MSNSNSNNNNTIGSKHKLDNSVANTTKKVKVSSNNPNNNSPNQNAKLVQILTQLGNTEKASGEKFKAVAYFKAARSIKLYSKPITSGKQAAELDGVGKKIAKKIDEILATGE